MTKEGGKNNRPLARHATRAPPPDGDLTSGGANLDNDRRPIRKLQVWIPSFSFPGFITYNFLYDNDRVYHVPLHTLLQDDFTTDDSMIQWFNGSMFKLGPRSRRIFQEKKT
jgi:hypothetical protein